MPHLVLGCAIPMFQVPHSARQWTGYALMALGACGCAVPVARFSARMIVGRERRGVVTAGPYRWSRNPQYVTDSGVPIGYARTGVAVMAWVGVALDLVLVHLTVLIEEEHLERQFGPAYRAYAATVPRYVRLRWPSPGR
jgi:protein-S-isoprenylcysteine O-methyltransferase Ste14